MILEEQLMVKLLAQASTQLARAVNEGLCTQPDRRLVLAMVAEAQELLGEFVEQYRAGGG